MDMKLSLKSTVLSNGNLTEIYQSKNKGNNYTAEIIMNGKTRTWMGN